MIKKQIVIKIIMIEFNIEIKWNQVTRDEIEKKINKNMILNKTNSS